MFYISSFLPLTNYLVFRINQSIVRYRASVKSEYLQETFRTDGYKSICFTVVTILLSLCIL
jgi:hypothetical protein